MGGTGFSIAIKPVPKKKQTPVDELVEPFAEAVREGVRTAIKRKRDLILAGLREESDSWKPMGDKIVLGFSDEGSPIVKHVAAMALVRERDDLVKYVLGKHGYQIATGDGASIGSVAPLRAAVWGTSKQPGSRTLGGPFVPGDDDELGWSEVAVAPPGKKVPDDAAARFAARTGLCGCEICGRIWTGTVLSPSSEKRSGRDAAIDNAHAKLDELGAKRSQAVLKDLDAWSWTGKQLPASFSKLLAELGRPAPTPLELAGILAVRA